MNDKEIKRVYKAKSIEMKERLIEVLLSYPVFEYANNNSVIFLYFTDGKGEKIEEVPNRYKTYG